MHPYLADFLIYIASEKGLSINTVEAYRNDLTKFLEFINVDNVANLEQNHIFNFLTNLKNQNYASASINRALVAIKVFCRFLKRESITKTNVALYIDSPKMWQLIPEVLTYREIEALLNQPGQHTAEGSRDKAIFEILYASGLRVSEVCGLNIYDVSDDEVRVMGKGKKERIVPLGKQALTAVDSYLTKYRCQWDSDKQPALFVNKRGGRIDRITIWKNIKHYAKTAGITKPISPHTLRHSFATHLLDNNAELRVIQEMLGHANIQSTDRYTHVSKTRLQDAFNFYHPRFR